MHLGGGRAASLNFAVSKHNLPLLRDHRNKTLLPFWPQMYSLSSAYQNPLRRRETHFRSLAVHCTARSSKGESHKSGEASLSLIEKKEEEKPPEDPKLRAELKEKIAKLKSNAEKVMEGGGGAGRLQRHTLGVDLGDAKTGLAISLGGFAPRPLSVVRQRGEKLLQTILQIAIQEKVDEFVVGLPKAWDGKDTEQANKCRSFAGRLAGLAAPRGWRVYLQDEYGTSQDALTYMIESGSNRRLRKEQLDAYAAMALLCSYFEAKGSRAQLVVPKQLDLQQLLCQGTSKPLISNLDIDDEFGDFDDD